MKKFIDGKRYDTETAHLVCQWSNGVGRSDFTFVEESLYITKNGGYFIHGRGGAASAYSEPCGSNASTGGQTIIPMTRRDVYLWLESRGLNSMIEEHFADMVVDA